MDIKTGSRTAALAMAARVLEEQKTKGQPVLIIDDAGAVPEGVFKKWDATIDIKPGEMWPDGKVRPHMMKTPAGEKLWLTAEEYDRIVLDARHRYYAGKGKQPPSSAPKPDLAIGDVVMMPDPQVENFAEFRVRNVKADGRVILEALNDDMGPFVEGQVVTVNQREYMVLRAGGGTATIRLRRAGEEPKPLPAPAAEPSIVLTRSCKVSDMTAAFNTLADRQREKELKKQRRLAGLAERRAQNREKNATDQLAAEIRRKGFAAGSSIRVTH